MFNNSLEKLLKKIEIRLGLTMIIDHLPDQLQKTKWVEIIDLFVLDTFSRYFPNKVRIYLNNNDKKDGYYLIDEDKIGNVEIIGIRDIGWDDIEHNNIMPSAGNYDMYSSHYDPEDFMATQLAADYKSLFSFGLYPEFKKPNMVKISGNGNMPVCLNTFPLDVFIKHKINLSSIEPTKMEIFEDLATAHIAKFLYDNLKYFEGEETIFGNIELRVEDFQSEASKLDQIVDIMQSNYVSFSNEFQPMILTI